MKKIYLSLIAVAGLFIACNESDILVDYDTTEPTPDQAIAFESFHQSATRAENNGADYGWAFFDHHTTFEVWGYKNTSETEVFERDVVTVTSDGAATPNYTYTYSPLRYWDKAALMYEYYAAAPSGANGDWTFERNGLVAANITTAANQNLAYFTTTSELKATNLSLKAPAVLYASKEEYNAANDPDVDEDGWAALTDAQKIKTAAVVETGLVESFKGAVNSDNTAGDVDKMIAEKNYVPYAQFKNSVQLDFIHILSRLNVTIKAYESVVAPANNVNKQKVIMKSLVVKNLLTKGDFSEKYETATAGVYSTAGIPAGSVNRWSNRSITAIDYTAIPNVELTSTAKYVIQSLVIPQEADFEVVALDGAAHDATPATYYATFDEYNAAKGYKSGDAGYVDETDFANLTDAQKTKTPEGTSVKAATDGTEPYLILTYTIQQTHDATGNEIDAGDLKTPEEFTAYFNLANAFGLQSGKLAFNEGWQNTLDITIKPATIEFCARVAEWSTVERGIVVD